MSDVALQGHPIIFGEVLFDEFEDGSAVLGGAPFNVAWHLQGFGLQPLFISRIGNDSLGDQVLAAMRQWHMDTRGVQIDAEHPTGRVKVTISNGQPAYDIVPDQAYDHIDAAAVHKLLSGMGGALLYHGSLIARDQVSRDALAALRAEATLPVFVDINLRAPWWDRPEIAALVKTAQWVKLNDDEVAALADTPLSALQLKDAAAGLREECGADLLIVTCGAEGAFVVSHDDIVQGDPVKAEAIVDTVGAGDGFSAVALLGLCRGWAVETTLARAMQFAAAICAQRGATRDDAELYRRYLRDWAE